MSTLNDLILYFMEEKLKGNEAEFYQDGIIPL